MKNCLNCKKEISNRYKYCSNTCQNDFQYKKYIEDWKSGKVSGLCASNKISHYLRKYLLRKCGHKCSICGWAEKNVYSGTVPLEVDHLNGNWRDNREENLMPKCPNCHSLTETYRNLNKGSGRPKRMDRYYAGKAY